MSVYRQEFDNMVRWQKGVTPFYEAYFLKFSIPEQANAFWLRFTLLSPKKLLGSPTAAVWGMVYNRYQPKENFAIKSVVTLDQTVMDRDIFYFQVKENAIYNNGSRGELASAQHRIRWDIQYVPQEETFKLYPASFYYLPFPKTKLIAPNWSVVATGELEIDGKKIPLQNVPACQAHLWGSHYAERWAWAHCNAFAESKEAVFEALTGQVRVGRRLLRPLTAIAFRTPDGKLLLFNRLSQMLFSRSQYQWGGWEITAQRGHYRLVAKLTNRPYEMMGVTYTDPDGSPLYCYHSESADLTVTLLTQQGSQWKPVSEFNAQNTTAFEVVERVPNPDIPLLL